MTINLTPRKCLGKTESDFGSLGNPLHDSNR